MRTWARRLVFALMLVVLLATSAATAVLWNQVGKLRTRLVSAESELAAYKEREKEAKRIDTSPQKNAWLLPNSAREALKELTRPKGFDAGIKKVLWDDSYTPRKDRIYDVAYVEWRSSGRLKEEGSEEVAEVLWVVAVINSSRIIGFDMTIDLEFLDSKGFRIAKDHGKGYIFPRGRDEELPRETQLRGSFWVASQLAKEIDRVTGTWRAAPSF